MRIENEEIINNIERVLRIKFPAAAEDAHLRSRPGGKRRHGGKGGVTLARCARRTEDAIQRDTVAESNVPRGDVTPDDVRA